MNKQWFAPVSTQQLDAARMQHSAKLLEFFQLVIEHASAMCVQMGRRCALLSDPQIGISPSLTRALLRDVVVLQSNLLKSAGSAFASKLFQELSGSLGVPADMIEQYSHLLLQGTEDECIRAFISKV